MCAGGGGARKKKRARAKLFHKITYTVALLPYLYPTKYIDNEYIEYD